MDFLLLLDRRRVVLGVDGVQRYADRQGRASPPRYAEMVSADRELQLAGYEVYRARQGRPRRAGRSLTLIFPGKNLAPIRRTGELPKVASLRWCDSYT